LDRNSEHNHVVARIDGSPAQAAGNAAGGALTAIYGTAVYLLFLAVFCYIIGFVTDADFMIGGVHVVGKSIDRGGIGDGTRTVGAVVIDAALLALFAIQHSIMARAGFKRRWTLVVPPSAERSTYVLATNICLVILIAGWHPITDDLWRINTQLWRALLTTLGLAGWATVLLSTFLIDHWDLFGMRQVFARLQGRQPPPHEFATPFLYRAVRHPLYLGFLIAFWAAPRMTVGHLLFAVATTGYILLAVRFEERDLIRAFGQQYRDYRRRVPMLIPRLRSHP
jgi:methanethiol S-methyltransferase